ncbi:SMP-30/gluconolactonase/LRE family protein [Verrucomicrobiales bacterium]|nr:SMP-30/gluconolactonase/LRE family protein [Verrucomicrobiales bacterium]
MKIISLLLLIFTLHTAFADISSIAVQGEKMTRLGTGMKFTEGPVWIKKEKRLVFSDIPNSLQMEWTSTKGVKEWRKVEQSNGNLMDLNGNILSCQHAGRNVIKTSSDGSIKVIADKFEGKKFNSPNDLAVRSNGEIWFTDPSYGLRGRKAEVDGKWVYKLKKDGSVSVVCKTFDMPNGIAFSPDEKRIYIADSGKIGKIRAYDVLEEGLLGEPAFKIDIRCDGMCVDTKGRIYTTAGGGIHVFDANGKKIGLIPVPEHPANVCFGGENYDTLFITARKSLYSIRINAKGQTVKAKK